jgi:hypothetical protein
MAIVEGRPKAGGVAIGTTQCVAMIVDRAFTWSNERSLSTP